MPKVDANRIGCFIRSKSAVTKSCIPEPRSVSRMRIDRPKAIMLIKTASEIRLMRSEPTVAPNTFCVLMLFTRIGVSARVKFMKLMVAMMTMRNETHNNR